MLSEEMSVKKIAEAWNEKWELLCHGCGKCCYEKHFIPGGSLVIDYDKPCRFLEEESKRCTVYVNRFNACKECQKITLWTALFSRALPPDCGYVVKVRGAIKHPVKNIKSILSIRRSQR
ncbi:hypothetical protein EXM22_01210 [Oceanispirochaeta crateris]|uniref:YcgN family cysteine cluster protein n=1 Tax=Oceanispirochaeta crateris TaxID=2518645 RepID=A0A5C1QF78_9SPIO|nr:hypothetical protein [Oceanispirochaeta crateris]QEN06675.1 hypothetical protein EXM22_01210 [Oceanispirochaeta crateris]